MPFITKLQSTLYGMGLQHKNRQMNNFISNNNKLFKALFIQGVAQSAIQYTKTSENMES